MSWTSAPKTAPLRSAPSTPARDGESVGEAGHPGPAGFAGVEVHVARARERRHVRRVHLGQRPTHPERVAQRGEEQRLGERRLEEVVGAGVDALRDVVEGRRTEARRRVGEHDDRHRLVGRIGPDAAAGLEAVALRGADADQDGLRLANGHGRQSAALPGPTARTS